MRSGVAGSLSMEEADEDSRGGPGGGAGGSATVSTQIVVCL
jgi:hypothetical protein